MTDSSAASAHVAAEIAAAFPRLPPPAPSALIGPSLGDAAGEEAIRRELVGKPWSSLDARFVQERWASFCYLSAEAYRYYLPALLLRSLEALPAGHALFHSTTYLLTPSAACLYFDGRDARFESQTSHFTRRQHVAVCAFLGLGLDTPVRFRSAQALRWGWSQHPHPALERARALYRAFHSFQYPPSTNPAAQSLIARICSAFAETPYPGDDRLCDSRQGDEPAEYALEFRGLDWRTLHPEFLAYHYPSLSFFPDEAFRYFLPAFLRADLMAPELEGTASGAEPTFHLTHGLVASKSTAGERERAVRRLSRFTPPERAAIVAYLEHVAHEPESMRADIEEALQGFWRTLD